MQFYDYVKIAPLSCYQHLFPLYGKDIVVQALKHIIELAKANNILLTATSNAYYFPEYFKIFHKIYILTKSIGNKFHRYNNHKQDETCVYQPLMYVRNTKDMLNQMHELIPDEQYLKEVAQKTWQFFKDYLIQENNYLIPDNYQEDRKQLVVSRTSSTNIGLSLLAVISAYDLKYIDLKNYIEKMREALSKTLDIDISLINVKATTEEKLGFTGRKEGISAHAVCLLKSKE